MVHAVRHDGLAPRALSPQTPQKLQWLARTKQVNDALEILGTKAGIKFPDRNERVSPTKRSKSPAHEIKNVFSILYFTDPPTLEHEITRFLEWLPALSNSDERLNYLLDVLKAAYHRIPKQTPGSSLRKNMSDLHLPATHGMHDETTYEELDRFPAPPSPTMSIKHAPKFGLNDSEIKLPPPTGLESAETSFISTSKGSIWSQLSRNSQEPSSTAMSFNTDFGLDGANDVRNTQESNYGPYLSSSFDPGCIDQKAPSLGQILGYPMLADSSVTQPTSPDEKSSTKQHKPAEAFGMRRDSAVPSRKQVKTQEFFGSSMSDGTLAQVEQHATKAPTSVDDARFIVKATDATNGFMSHDQHKAGDEKMRSPERAKSRIDNIPVDGLLRIKLPDSCQDLQLDLKWECCRVLQTEKITTSELDRQWTFPRTMATLHRIVKDLGIRFHPSAQIDPKKINLHAKLRWSKSDVGPVFYLELLPIQHEDLNSFQRQFGAGRFFHLDIPALFSPPKHTRLARQGRVVCDKVAEMLDMEHVFLDRRWKRFLAQTQDPSQKDPDLAIPGVRQITLFALDGHDLDYKSIVELIDWALPLQENGNERACKAYARLELSASRSTPTITVDPWRIDYRVEDIYPDNTPDDKTFNDPDAEFTDKKSDDPMTDGCCRISRWAMLQIAEKLGWNYIPSLIQARHFGAKGVWYVDDDQTTEVGNDPPEIVIEIAKSQAKVLQKPIDFTQAYNREKLTINVVGWSRPARPSYLYPDQMPILINRGVPRDNIGSIVHRTADAGHQELLSSIQDRHRFRRYIHCQNSFREERSRGSGIEELADFPRSREEKVVQALESGFEPQKCWYVADEIKQLVMQLLDPRNKNIKVPVPRSTMLYAIADRWNCLEPGEVQVCFSHTFRDPTTGQSWNNLRNLTGLVSRLPALAAWDIQRVKFVVRPELSHLTDLIVFSAKGPRSLASKCQGGDYDGDSFWICWEPLLVQPFRNFPVKPAEHNLDDLRIRENKKKLGEVIEFAETGKPTEASVLKWIKENSDIRMGRDMLGTITLTYGRVIYAENDLNSKGARLFLDLHHNMIDASKRGLSFNWDDLNALKRKHQIPELKDPAHRQFTAGADSNDAADMAKRADPKPNDNIIDYVFFNILERKAGATLAAASRLLENAVYEDKDLLNLYEELCSSAKGQSAILSELEAVPEKLDKLKQTWDVLMKDCVSNHWNGWDACVENIRRSFKEILPENLAYFTDIWWLRSIGNSTSMWDLVKALALAKHQNNGKMMFYAAGHELCWLKALAGTKARLLDMPAYQRLLPSKRKREEGDDEDDMEYGDDGALLAALSTTTDG